MIMQSDDVPMYSFDELAIKLTNGASRVFASTDHAGGFWEYQTFASNEHGGYILTGTRFLKDIRWHVDGVPLLREEAECVHIYPHQSITGWANGITLTQTVLLGMHGLILTLNSNTPVCWMMDSVFYQPMEDLVFQSDKGIFDVGYTQENWRASFAFCDQTGAMSDHVNTLKTEKTTECTLVVLFHQNKDELHKQMRRVQQDPQSFVEERRRHVAALLETSFIRTNLPEYDKAICWAKISGDDLVAQEFGKGIWAGLPWFHQGWGRDTFISLPGISLVTGQFGDAAAIIRSFADYQITEPDSPIYGRVPNRVCSLTDIIYNTTDGTPWLIREIVEYVLLTGDQEFARDIFPVMQRAIDGVLMRYVDDDGFMIHADADTWMDAKLEGRDPWSPRGNRAVDIQALWYTQLRSSAVIARLLGHNKEAADWEAHADRLRRHFVEKFTDVQHTALFDHLNEDGSPDQQIRPNQMFAVTVPMTDPLIDEAAQAGVVRQVVSDLTYPHGVASLSQNDPDFHPYHHNQIYFFDAAYHNGLCWQWNAGPVISGMIKTGYTDLAFKLTKEFTRQILHEGMPGSLSELVEPFKNASDELVPSGTYSQAWSVAEFVRNVYQDYLGFRANMLTRTLQLQPRLPGEWTHLSCLLNMGDKEHIYVTINVDKVVQTVTISAKQLQSPVDVTLILQGSSFRAHHAFDLSLHRGETKRLRFDANHPDTALVNNAMIKGRTQPSNYPEPDATLSFQIPRHNPTIPSLTQPDMLEKRIRTNAQP
ncbi:MAG: hypothetical protein EOL87_02725 [Spartobacteria bacterium]|nr:hypothetical protein [Spartobacteria bacterium]